MYVNMEVKRGFEAIEDIFDICARVGGVIAGGYVRWMCSPNPDPVQPGDVDVFPRIKDNENALIDVFIKAGYALGMTAETGVELMHPLKPRVNIIRSNELLRTFGDAAWIISGFDFIVCQAALLNAKTALVHPDFAADEGSMLLRISAINNPLAVFMRPMKYAHKGYAMPPADAVRVLDMWLGFSPDSRDEFSRKAGVEVETISMSYRYDGYDEEDDPYPDDDDYYDDEEDIDDCEDDEDFDDCGEDSASSISLYNRMPDGYDEPPPLVSREEDPDF
jgi:hypothetical protein